MQLVDGNMTQDGVYTYTYDAENRLICVAPTTPAAGQKKVESVYDYMGRRVRKVVTAWDASLGTGGDWEAVPESSTHFVYDGWNLVLELDGSATGLGGDGLPTYSNAAIREYTWGLDLSGLSGNPTVSGIHGAGGIGGLLAVEQPMNSFQFVYFYDANGNVGQAYNHTLNSLVARYEYDPYGNIVNTTGALFKSTNPFRFSTKYFDKELDLHGTNDGLYYYGYRFYSPRLGRWVNRDPIGEAGGFSLQEFLRSSPTNTADPLGLACFDVWQFEDYVDWYLAEYGQHLTSEQKDWARNKANYGCIGITCMHLGATVDRSDCYKERGQAEAAQKCKKCPEGSDARLYSIHLYNNEGKDSSRKDVTFDPKTGKADMHNWDKKSRGVRYTNFDYGYPKIFEPSPGCSYPLWMFKGPMEIMVSANHYHNPNWEGGDMKGDNFPRKRITEGPGVPRDRRTGRKLIDPAEVRISTPEQWRKGHDQNEPYYQYPDFNEEVWCTQCSGNYGQ